MSPDERAAAVLPAAAALVCAVADHDPDEVARVLGAVTDWQALMVVLAGHVPTDSPLGVLTAQQADDEKARLILDSTAARFGVPATRIRSKDRRREVIDARAVAMAAMRYAGLTSTFIGRYLGRDHTTVLYAAGRVGEDRRLHGIATSLAGLVGARVGLLGDETTTATTRENAA